MTSTDARNEYGKYLSQIYLIRFANRVGGGFGTNRNRVGPRGTRAVQNECLVCQHSCCGVLTGPCVAEPPSSVAGHDSGEFGSPRPRLRGVYVQARSNRARRPC